MNIYELASEMIVDGVIPFDHLRDELCHRFQAYTSKEMTFTKTKTSGLSGLKGASS